jgi:hypothetical protein
MLSGKSLAGNYYFLSLSIIVVKNTSFGALYSPHTHVQMWAIRNKLNRDCNYNIILKF